ncbi:MAG: class I SAM-dependent methyltransferase [Adhaeribacter sp.]
MVERKVKTDELAARRAFSKQAALFDALYAPNPIIQYKRQRVRSLVLPFLRPGQRILELNAGTGEDAVFFAQRGYRVHATDLSEDMLQVLKHKVCQAGLQDRVSTEVCSFTGLEALSSKGPYDLIFSNFAGLNCTAHLDQVLASFSSLLKPGGRVVLTVMPGFCLWECLLALKGHFKMAFRRTYSRKGAAACIEGQPFRCWYYPPGYISKHLGASFRTLKLEGLCSLVPPSFLEFFPVRHPLIYSWLVGLEDKWKGSWPWKYIGDYYIMALEKHPS